MKELFGKSNRVMASMLAAFSLLSGVDVSYKTLERLYSDAEVEMAIHNLHTLILKRRGVKSVDASETRKRKEKAKKESSAKGGKKGFVYSFRLLDLKSKMYVAYGMSSRSEKEAFDRAMEMLREVGVELESVRLDRYYSFPSYVDRFGDPKVYVIPRRDATLRGSWKWKHTMKEFTRNTLSYLEQYYLRNNSESGFSADKRWFGWKVGQRREDNIETALTCTSVWHNLLNLYPS